jgi:hypothetical protein
MKTDGSLETSGTSNATFQRNNPEDRAAQR